MLLGHRWGFLLALIASVPFWYTAIPIFIWDRDLGFRQNTLFYWVIVWGMFPAYGVLEGAYTFVRLLEWCFIAETYRSITAFSCGYWARSLCR